MTTSWDRQSDETEAWYDRFKLYLYMGPDRTLAAAHAFATRLAKGAVHAQLGSWRRAAQRHQWQARAAEFDAEMCRKAMVGDERLKMVAELLQQVYGVLRHADLLTLSKEEARQLLPTFRLFFRDLLQFHQTQAAHLLAAQGSAELTADDLVKFLGEVGGWQSLLAEIERVTERATETESSEANWQPLRDVLAHFYPDETSARRIAAQAHLDNARIHFAPRAVDSWHAILTEAAHAGHLDHVIDAAQQEYGTNPELIRAVQRYRHSHISQSRTGQSRSQPSRSQGRKPQTRRKI